MESLALRGSYTYFAELSAAVMDVLDLTVELNNATCMLFSFYLKYFLCIKDNYLSSFQSHMDSATFRDWVPGRSSLGHADRPSNVLDAYVRVVSKGPVSISIPVDMFSPERTVLGSIDYLTLEVRSHASFMTLQLDVSPIAVVIPCAPGDRELETTIARSLRLATSPNLEADGFSLGFYLYYGPRPQRETYRETFNIRIGQVRGQVVAGQVITAITMLKNLFHHLYNWDNEVRADIAPYNKAIKAGKLRSLMEVDVVVTGVDLYVAMMDTLVHLATTEGAHIHYDTRHTHMYTDVIRVNVPRVNILQFLPLTTGHGGLFTDQDDWTDVANIQLGIDIDVVSKRDTWLAEMRDQNSLIALCDAPSGRCAVYLRQTVAQLEARVAELEAERGGKKTGSAAPDAAAGAAADDALPMGEVSAEQKRCGRMYRATLPAVSGRGEEEDDDDTYSPSESLVFRPLFEANESEPNKARAARADAKVREERACASGVGVGAEYVISRFVVAVSSCRPDASICGSKAVWLGVVRSRDGVHSVRIRVGPQSAYGHAGAATHRHAAARCHGHVRVRGREWYQSPSSRFGDARIGPAPGRVDQSSGDADIRSRHVVSRAQGSGNHFGQHQGCRGHRGSHFAQHADQPGALARVARSAGAACRRHVGRAAVALHQGQLFCSQACAGGAASVAQGAAVAR